MAGLWQKLLRVLGLAPEPIANTPAPRPPALDFFMAPIPPSPFDSVEPPDPALGKVEIDLPKITDTGTFARYVPFGDKREIVVRRGTSTGFEYGFKQGQRRVTISGLIFEIATYESTLSPPVHIPGTPLTGDPEGSYHPVSDILYLPGVEVLIPRRPLSRGFTDGEVHQILHAIRIVQL